MSYVQVDSNQGSCRHFWSGLAQRNARSDDPWPIDFKGQHVAHGQNDDADVKAMMSQDSPSRSINMWDVLKLHTHDTSKCVSLSRILERLGFSQ
jgi:ABC-type cobalamin transport system ATPase subunit